MIPGSVKAVIHRFSMAKAHIDTPIHPRIAPPRTGNLSGLFVGRTGAPDQEKGLTETGKSTNHEECRDDAGRVNGMSEMVP